MFCRKLLLIVAVLTVAALGVAGPANATITYGLGTPNSDISAYPGLYGYVSVDRLSNTSAKVVFTGATQGAYSYLFGAEGAVGLNIHGNWSSWTADVDSLGNNGADAGNEDGLGAYNFTLKNTDGAGHAFRQVTLTINAAGNTTWANDADVLEATSDSQKHFAAAHIFVFQLGQENGKALATGYAADNGVVPEPASLAVWGLGACMVGLVGGIRRRIARQT